ncbi:hypothetical protein J2S37_002449 [Corynebacterium felinum]|uniref:Uncharacterized protein n=1 Tax=Corynebacterium felinum TaxID=131318 RepID=A0ABU2BC17_9CORY|nr:hypothetical protein [Corynebacterium felinum]
MLWPDFSDKFTIGGIAVFDCKGCHSFKILAHGVFMGGEFNSA